MVDLVESSRSPLHSIVLQTDSEEVELSGDCDTEGPIGSEVERKSVIKFSQIEDSPLELKSF